MDVRQQKTLVTFVVFSLPFLVWLAISAKSNTQDLNNWIDKSADEYAQYLQFIEQFGNDDEIFVSWDNCTPDDARLAHLAKRIREIDQGRFFHSVMTGAEAATELVNSASKFSESSSRRRLRGSLFGDDLKTTCVVIRLTTEGTDHRAKSVDRIQAAIEELAKPVASLPFEALDMDSVHVAGKSVASVSLDRFTNRSLLAGIPGAVVGGMIAWICIRHIFLATSLIFVAGYAALLSLAVVPLCGVQVNGLLVLMPVLVFVLTLGCGVHLVRAVQRSWRDGNMFRSSFDAALIESRPPIVMAMLTTAIGIGTLGFSPVSAVRQFGWFTGGSLVAATLLLLFLLPAIWNWFGREDQHQRFVDRQSEVDDQVTQPTRWTALAFRYPGILTGLFALFSLPAIVGLSRFETDLNVSKLFDSQSRVARDHRWIQENLFPLGRVELVVRFPRATQSNRFQQLGQVRRIQTAIRKSPNYHSALSVANLVNIPVTQTPLERQVVRQLIASQIDYDATKLNEEGLLHDDSDFQRWRISIACRVDAVNDEQSNAVQFFGLAHEAIPDNPFQIELTTTGIGPLAAGGQRRLFSDLVWCLGLAFVVITPLIAIVLRDWRLGLIAMVPNLFPILIVFGYCGLLGRRLDIGAILTASVGLGIAVDDTLHFLHYYRLGLKSGTNETGQKNAVRFALSRCATAIITTTAIICSGLTLFTFSQFVPVRQFAICLILMMMVAAIADLLLLPAMILFAAGCKPGPRPG